MSAKKPWTSEQAGHALDRIAESIEAAKPSDIEDDLRSAGEDLDSVTALMKDASLAGIKNFRQQRLHRARQRHEENVSTIARRASRIAGSPKARREQFFAVLKANPSVQSALTLQYRDLNEITDADIETALDELDALGALGDPGNDE